MTANGLLVIDKPKGMTSHDVVAKVRRCLQTRRVGHAGTLDPDATGVLVLCVGEATRLIEYLVSDDKAYSGTMVIGVSTDTDDESGLVLDRMSASHLSLENVEVAAGSFVGSYDQRVPAYSAVHIDGERAYKLARRGETPNLPVRKVTIHDFDVVGFAPGDIAALEFQVTCSKGTYIRSLCRDFGERLGLCAHLSNLRRIRSGGFSLDDSVALLSLQNSDNPSQYLLPMETAVASLPTLVLPDSLVIRIASGQSVPVTMEVNETTAVFAETGQLCAIGSVRIGDGRNVFHPSKVFAKRGRGHGRV